jgi:hypothetical protein
MNAKGERFGPGSYRRILAPSGFRRNIEALRRRHSKKARDVAPALTGFAPPGGEYRLGRRASRYLSDIASAINRYDSHIYGHVYLRFLAACFSSHFFEIHR